MRKQKKNKPDGRRSICPQWDRWNFRIPNLEEQRRVLELYRKSGAASKSDFVRARLLGESFKVITENKSAEPYLRELSNIVELTRKIGILYNEAVKMLNVYHSVASAQRILHRLETYSEALIGLQRQAIILTIKYQAKEATK